MKRTLIASAIAATLAWQTPVLAGDDIGQLEVGGVIEIEGFHTSTDGAPDEKDLQLSKIELGIGLQMTDWLGAETTLLWEENEFSVDSFTFTLSQPDGPWSLTAGKQGLPFGNYATNLVSDPLTLEIGETAENMAWVASYEGEHLTASAFVARGSNSKGISRNMDHFGASVGYASNDLSVSLGYINDISDSDSIQEALASNSNVDYVAGWTASAVYTTGPVTVIGEYLTATDGIAGLGGEQPSAWNLEAGYGFNAFGKEAVFAVAYQRSKEASSLDIAEKRLAAAVSFELMEGTGLGLELARETAYDGTDSRTLTALLSVEF